MTIQLRAGNAGSPGATSSLTATLPVGFQQGDFCILQVSEATGNPTFTPPTGWNSLTDVGITNAHQAAYYRILQTGDANPVVGSTVSAPWSWSTAAFDSSLGRTLAFDSKATVATNTTGVTSITPNSDTVVNAGSDHLSIVTLAAEASAAAITSSHTFTPPSGWTNVAASDGWNDGTASVKARGTFICWKDAVTGTVSPGSESITDSASDTFNLATNNIVIYELSAAKPGLLIGLFP